MLLVFLPMLVFEGALVRGRRQHAAGGAADPGAGAARRRAVAARHGGDRGAGQLGLPFPIALLLGALLAITDTVSVLLAFRSVRVPHRLAAIMEGESLFNDGTALVLVSVAATVPWCRASPIRRQIARAAGHRDRRRRAARRRVRHARRDRAAPRPTTSRADPRLAGRGLRDLAPGRALRRLAGHRGGRRGRAHRARDAGQARAVARAGAAGLLGDCRVRLNVALFLLVGMQLRSDLLLQEAWADPAGGARAARRARRRGLRLLRRAAAARRSACRGAGST